MFWFFFFVGYFDIWKTKYLLFWNKQQQKKVFGWVETLTLHINMTFNGYLVTLSFPVRIHETPNDDSRCPYISDAGFGCSDRVWLTRSYMGLPPPFVSQRRRVVDEQQSDVETLSQPLVVSLMGIRSHPLQQRAVTDFVSQERRETFSYLYASILPVDQAKLHSIDSLD